MKQAIGTLLLLLVAVATGSASTTVTIDAGFYRFGLNQIGAPVAPRAASGDLLASAGSPFDFTAIVAVTLIIVDLQLSFDRFQVFINGVDRGLTSSQTEGGNVGLDPLAALADPRFSRGIYPLAPGFYSVNVVLAEGALLPGSGALAVSTAVPEPSALALFASGILGLLALRRRLKP
jgi:hypothetical protein